MKVAILLLSVTLAGCGFLSRTKSTFYSLETTPFEGSRAATTGVPIAIEGIELPPGLDRREIAVRGAGQELEIRETHQWSGPLEDMVIHTLAFNVARRLPEGMVVLPGQAKPAGAVRPLYITFEELTAGPENTFVLDARWKWGTSGPAAHERIEVPTASLDSAEVVRAMSAALARLADRIAAQ
jgi:uncharacterized lipoprotein YmbA